MARSSIQRVIERLAEENGLDVPLDVPAEKLSIAEQERLEILKLLERDVRLLVLDEPTSALGVKEAAIVLRYIVAAQARGLGIILITHNVNHAYPVGERFVILDRGQA